LKRGSKDAAAEILEEVVRSPNLAVTRIVARTSVNYQFLKVIAKSQLVQIENASKRRKKLIITDKGRQFLQHYRICNTLFPQEA
jgi:predicted transcriptional regulator